MCYLKLNLGFYSAHLWGEAIIFFSPSHWVRPQHHDFLLFGRRNYQVRRCFGWKFGKSATRTVGGVHCVHSSRCVQWPCPMNVQWASIDPSIGHVPKCWKCPLVTNGHNRHSVFIIGDQWTCPMDKIDVHCVHFIVHNRHTRFTSICWRLRFGWWHPMSIISVMNTMDTIDTLNVHWAQ